MSGSTFQQRTRRLKEKFLEMLPERLETAWALLGEFDHGQVDKERLHQLRTLFHNLKGTSSTYGFPELAHQAAAAESLLDTGFSPDSDQLARLLQEMARIALGLDVSINPESEPLFDISSCRLQPDHIQIKQNAIYLCDDDPQQRRQIIEQLSCFGYQVTGFDDPLELVEAVRSTPPDVIIMDIIFPGGENYGLEVIRRLQTQLDQPIPTIFISGRGDFDARLRAVRAGGIAYCTKPVIPIDLVDILDNLGERAEPEPYRVLVVDDDPDLVTYIDMVLREAGMEVKISTRPHEVLDTLPLFNADLVLMDLYMSDCVGAELARVLRQIPGYIGLPIVYLSGETDRERQFSALSVGADGFLTKPIQPDQLINTVTLRAERMRSLRRLMVRDSLTGLYNHSNCKLLLDQGFSHAHRRKSPLSLAMIDLDHFKQINDDYGHAVGDQVIIGLSRLLRQRLRKSDIIGRYGGEEFVVILPDTPAEDAIQIMDQLRTGFATILFHAAEGDFHVTFSCGVASSATCNSSSQLRSLSDSALYQAKSRGRNCCLVSEQGEGSSGG